MRVRKVRQLRLSPYALSAALVVTAWLFGANQSFAQNQSVADRVLDRGEVIIGTSSTNAPFGFRNEEGELVGFDIDIGKLLAKTLFDDEKKARFEVISLEARWPSIQTDKVDAIIMLTTILPPRLTKVAFTPRYVDSGMVAIVREDSEIQSLAELDSEEVELGSLTVPWEVDLQKAYFPQAGQSVFESQDEKLLALKSGRVDAITTDLPIGMWYVSEADGLRMLPGTITGLQNYAIAYKLGDAAWSKILDTFVYELRTGSLYEQYTEIYQKWFGRNPPPPRFYNVAQ